jgi:hypothetical protein
MKRPYASETEVTVERSKMQIERLLTEFKASSIMMGSNAHQSIIAFEMAERRIKFVLPLPQLGEFPRHRHRNPRAALEQATRTRWRALYLALRAKLEMAATGITTFEDEFLAHVMMPDGQTVGEMTRPRIAQAYQSGEVRPLLEGPR